MPSPTLVQAKELSRDFLVQGVIDSIIEIDPMFQFIPMLGVEGASYAYNRELAIGSAVTLGVGDSIAAGYDPIAEAAASGKDPATTQRTSVELTTILADAEVNGLVQSTLSGDAMDQTVHQVLSKAKQMGRQWRKMFINGDGANNTFTGLRNLVAGGQTIPEVAGDMFATLDSLLDLVTDKDGQVDYLLMSPRSIRRLRAELRSQGGATILETRTLPNGTPVGDQFLTYNGIPIFRNDFIPDDLGAGTNESVVIAGTLDDGSESYGITGLTSSRDAGIVVKDSFLSETKDEEITRLTWYTSLALYSEKGLAMATGVLAS